MADVLLKQMAEDLRLIRRDIAELKEEVNDLRDVELDVRPEYLEKLEKIRSGQFKRFSSLDELRNEIEKE